MGFTSNTVMEREQQENNPIEDLAPHVANPKSLMASSSVFDSLDRQMRMVDSVIEPIMTQQFRVLGTIERSLVRVLDSSAFVQAVRSITSSAWVTQFTQMSAQFQTAINRLSLPINRDLFLPLNELTERFGKASSVRGAFRHYNLWLAPSMSEELVGKIVHLFEANAGSGTVHSMVSRYYARENWCRLEEILERCQNNSLFKSRIKLIEEAFRAHREGLYNLTVTVLLVHLEGIAADYVKKHKLLPIVGGKTRQIILAALNDTPYSLFDVRTYAGVRSLIAYVEDSMYASVDFDKEHVRLQGENRLMGHAVRHGRQVAFGSRMNSLRMFLIIDVMTLLEN